MNSDLAMIAKALRNKQVCTNCVNLSNGICYIGAKPTKQGCDSFAHIKQTHASEIFGEITMTRPTPTENLPAVETQNLASLPAAISPDHFEAIKAIGRIETAQFYATVADKITAETALRMKETKQYKGLPYKDKNGNTRHVALFDEFCEVFLGKSVRRVQELMGNYNLLGSDLYEQAEQIGFRQRDYNALKALPADDQKIITAAIEDSSLEKDKIIDLMQEMAAKHFRDREASTTKITALEKDNAAKDSVISIKDQKLNEMEFEIQKMSLDRPIHAHLDYPESFKGYLNQLTVTRKNLKHSIGSLEIIRQEAMKIEPQSPEEEASLDQGKRILADELVGIHNECLEMIEALGLSFDKTLGAYSDARINLLS
jgi:hypothetical protein